MKQTLTLEATIPTVQYGNVKPTIVLEGEFDEIRDKGLQQIKQISDMVAGEGYSFDVRGLPVVEGRTVMTAQKAPTVLTSEFTGTSCFYDDSKHVYTNEKGDKYTSSSAFPDKFYPPFMSKEILDAMVLKYPGATSAELQAMWKLNSEASTGYGTAIHAALENFDKNKKLGKLVQGENEFNKALSKNPFLRQIVLWFQEGKDDEDVVTEAFVANSELMICGRIDRLKFVDREKKVVRVQDYKTDGDILDKKYQVADSPFKAAKKGEPVNPNAVENNLVGYHRLQLNHLSHILTLAGYTVEGTDIFWLNPAKLVKGENPWETFSHDTIDITKGL